MILKEFTSTNHRQLEKISQALVENYDYDIDFDRMTRKRAHRLAERARKRVAESKDLNQRIKFRLIAESLDLWTQAKVQTELTAMVAEGLDDESMEEAKVILAAKELGDNIQKMIEDAAKMQVQDLLPIVDAMKSEIGSAEADAFSESADAALGGLVEALKNSKSEFDNAIAAAQGLEPASDMDSFDLDGDDQSGDMEVDMDAMDDDPEDFDDEFGGDETEVGDAEPSGREMKDEF